MKTFSGPEKINVSPREAAQGCLSANLAIPGLGTIIAGRKAGYVQLAMYLCGFVLTLVFGGSFILKVLSHWSEFYNEFYGPNADLGQALGNFWQGIRWALLGIGLFIVSWVWALATSRSVMAAARKQSGG